MSPYRKEFRFTIRAQNDDLLGKRRPPWKTTTSLENDDLQPKIHDIQQ